MPLGLHKYHPDLNSFKFFINFCNERRLSNENFYVNLGDLF